MFKLMKIAVLSDIHGNMEAFREVVKYLEKEQIKKVLILGDIIDYGPHSNEVITCLMDLPWVSFIVFTKSAREISSFR